MEESKHPIKDFDENERLMFNTNRNRSFLHHELTSILCYKTRFSHSIPTEQVY